MIKQTSQCVQKLISNGGPPERRTRMSHPSDHSNIPAIFQHCAVTRLSIGIEMCAMWLSKVSLSGYIRVGFIFWRLWHKQITVHECGNPATNMTKLAGFSCFAAPKICMQPHQQSARVVIIPSTLAQILDQLWLNSSYWVSALGSSASQPCYNRLGITNA